MHPLPSRRMLLGPCKSGLEHCSGEGFCCPFGFRPFANGLPPSSFLQYVTDTQSFDSAMESYLKTTFITEK